MAFNWSNALQGALRGGFPDVAASVDQGKNTQSLIQSRQFQDLLNQARLVAQNQQMQQSQEDRSLLTPEERKQKMLDPAGYRQLRSKSGPTGGNAVEAAENVGKIAKARSEFGYDIPDNIARFFDDSTNDVMKPYEKSPVDVVAEAFGTAKGQDDASITAADKKARAALIERGMADDDEQASAMVLNAVEKMPGFSQRRDNRDMFAGESFVQQAPQAQAPKTFYELGIGDAQSQQIFNELETKVSGLRELYASDPETFQRLFAAVKSGKLTRAEAISLIEQSQQL